MSVLDEPHVIRSGKLLKATEKAWLISFDDADTPLWIPKSQGEWNGPDEWALTLWIAKEKGLS